MSGEKNVLASYLSTDEVDCSLKVTGPTSSSVGSSVVYCTTTTMHRLAHVTIQGGVKHATPTGKLRKIQKHVSKFGRYLTDKTFRQVGVAHQLCSWGGQARPPANPSHRALHLDCLPPARSWSARGRAPFLCCENSDSVFLPLTSCSESNALGAKLRFASYFPMVDTLYGRCGNAWCAITEQRTERLHFHHHYIALTRAACRSAEIYSTARRMEISEQVFVVLRTGQVSSASDLRVLPRNAFRLRLVLSFFALFLVISQSR